MHQQLTKIDNIVIKINLHQFLVGLVCVFVTKSETKLQSKNGNENQNQMPCVEVIIRNNHMYLWERGEKNGKKKKKSEENIFVATKVFPCFLL